MSDGFPPSEVRAAYIQKTLEEVTVPPGIDFGEIASTAVDTYIRRQARVKFVESETDLSRLPPGSIVRVGLAQDTLQAMMYGGSVPHGTHTRCTFVDLDSPPQHLDVRESDLTYLQFPGKHIQFNAYHWDYRKIEPDAPDYARLRALLNTT